MADDEDGCLGRVPMKTGPTGVGSLLTGASRARPPKVRLECIAFRSPQDVRPRVRAYFTR